MPTHRDDVFVMGVGPGDRPGGEAPPADHPSSRVPLPAVSAPLRDGRCLGFPIFSSTAF